MLSVRTQTLSEAHMNACGRVHTGPCVLCHAHTAIGDNVLLKTLRTGTASIKCY